MGVAVAGMARGSQNAAGRPQAASVGEAAAHKLWARTRAQQALGAPGGDVQCGDRRDQRRVHHDGCCQVCAAPELCHGDDQAVAARHQRQPADDPSPLAGSSGRGAARAAQGRRAGRCCWAQTHALARSTGDSAECGARRSAPARASRGHGTRGGAAGRARAPAFP